MVMDQSNVHSFELQFLYPRLLSLDDEATGRVTVANTRSSVQISRELPGYVRMVATAGVCLLDTEEATSIYPTNTERHLTLDRAIRCRTIHIGTSFYHFLINIPTKLINIQIYSESFTLQYRLPCLFSTIVLSEVKKVPF